MGARPSCWAAAAALAAADTDTGSEAISGYGGNGKHLHAFPVRAGQQINFVGFVPVDGQTRESRSAPGDPATLAAELADWNPQACRLLDQVDATFTWGLYDRNPLTRWTNGRRAASLKGLRSEMSWLVLNVRFYLGDT
jgi:hypothetical protein